MYISSLKINKTPINMKKLITSLLAITFMLLLFTSCGSSKKGCGLTSDASLIQKSATSEIVVVAEAD